MSMSTPFRLASVSGALIACALVASSALAADAPAKAAKHAKSSRTAKATPAPVFAVPDAQPEQVKAAELVYYGMYDCEFSQTVNITQSSKYPAYVDLKHGKNDWLMKPVLSSTGAIRLEDVRGETLMVQISSKSMLLNVKTAHRIVDDCMSAKQRELMAEAKAAKATSDAAGTTVTTTTLLK
ncbi:MAG: hypothetical protein ABIZ18_04170 [Caldimonas sp.]